MSTPSDSSPADQSAVLSRARALLFGACTGGASPAPTSRPRTTHPHPPILYRLHDPNWRCVSTIGCGEMLVDERQISRW
ncbi:hypothetical protein LY78DRAFT_663045 [Colletotrichum sublineola]|nr:hypothetical protein LY78DRAFT_663045 [Colletotrichum sublineola]